MQVPLELAFHGLEKSDAIESLVRERVVRLEKFFDGIVSCRIAVEVPNRSEVHIQTVRVRIDVSVPGNELLVDYKPTEDELRQNDLYYAVDQAFDKMERQLKDYKEELQEHRDVRFPTEPNGVVVDVNRDEGFGYIESVDGREVYFGDQSLEDVTLDELEEGSEVKLVVGSGLDSPQPVARRVRPA